MQKRDSAHTIILTCPQCGKSYPVDIDPEPQIEDIREHLAICKKKQKVQIHK